MKEKIAVSVCDEEGHLVAFQRMGGASSESVPLAIGRAIAAAASRKSSGARDASFENLQRVWRLAGAGLPIVPGPGGCAITRDGQALGGIGVSGSATNQKDEQCAKAGAEALDQRN